MLCIGPTTPLPLLSVTVLLVLQSETSAGFPQQSAHREQDPPGPPSVSECDSSPSPQRAGALGCRGSTSLLLKPGHTAELPPLCARLLPPVLLFPYVLADSQSLQKRFWDSKCGHDSSHTF